MFVYLFLLLLTVIATFIGGKNRKNVGWGVFIILNFIFLVGLRGHNVGTDTDNYWYAYLYQMGNRMEPLFHLVRDCCRYINLSVNAYFTVLSTLTFLPLWWFIKRESSNFGFSLLIYYTFSTLFFFQTFNVVRACLAISYLLVCCFYIRNNKYKRAIFFALIAVMFHYSALMIIFIIIITSCIKRLNFFIVLASISITFIIGLSFGTFVQDLAVGLSAADAFTSADSEALDNYQNYLDKFEDSTWNLVGALATMLPFSVITILTFNKEHAQNIYYRLLFIGVIINNAFVAAMFTYRITMYLLIFSIIVLPNAYSKACSIKKLMIIGFTTLMVLWFIYSLITANDSSFNEAYPYEMCFNDV